MIERIDDNATDAEVPGNTPVRIAVGSAACTDELEVLYPYEGEQMSVSYTHLTLPTTPYV